MSWYFKVTRIGENEKPVVELTTAPGGTPGKSGSFLAEEKGGEAVVLHCSSVPPIVERVLAGQMAMNRNMVMIAIAQAYAQGLKEGKTLQGEMN